MKHNWERTRCARWATSSSRGVALALLLLVASASGQSARYRDPVFPSVNEQHDLVYGAALNPSSGQFETLRLDLYTPHGDNAARRAAVVVVHGGGFVGGDKAEPQIVALARRLTRLGYLVVSINYRLGLSGAVTHATVVDAAEDFKAAVRYLRAHEQPWHIDTGRIACIGSSAGAFTVLQGAYMEPEGSSGNPAFSSEVHAVADLWGGLHDLNEMEAGEAPLIIVHGTADPVVPYQQALDLEQRALTVGLPHELHPVIAAGHAPWMQFFGVYIDDVIAFYYEHLHLGQLSGLAAQAGFSSPGSVTLDSFGIAGDEVLLALSLGAISQDIPGLGVLCLDSGSLLLLPTATLPGVPRLPTLSTTLSVPAGLSGTDVYWQAIHSGSGVPRLLTNCVVTSL